VARHWPAIGEELRQRRAPTLRLLLTGVGLDVDALAELLRVLPDGTAEATEAFTAAFTVAADEPEAAVLLAAYVYAVALEAWELTSDWDVISAYVGCAAGAFAATRGPVDRQDPAEARLAALFLDQAGSLHEAMLAENALNCSCPVDLGVHAGKVVDRAKAVLGAAADLRERPAGAVVAAWAGKDRAYFSALVTTGAAVEAYIDGGATAARRLRSAATAVRRAERDANVRGDVYESELRAHRLTLVALAEGWPRIHVGEAKVVYCYPFALDVAPAEAVRRADGAREWPLPGGAPTDVQSLRLTDAWDGEADEGASFGGVAVTLPAPVVTTTYGDEIDDYVVEVRLSNLGNHYVRVEHWERGATLHDMHQAMRRATDQMGAERLDAPGDQWVKFVDFVGDTVDAVAEALGGTPTKGTAHVVVSVRTAEVEDRDGTMHAADAGEVLAAKGASLFLQPVRQAATTLEEWIRYPTPDVGKLNLLGDLGFTGDVLVRTANTTFLMMPASPNFLVIEYEEMAEFVASLPALLRGWTEAIEAKVRAAMRALDDLRGDELRVRLREVERDQVALRGMITRARSELAHLHSPQLCLTTVHRAMLDRLWDAAGLPQLERDLSAQFEVADGLYAQLATHRARLDEQHRAEVERREKGVRRFIEVALAILAVASLTGLAELVNGAFGFGVGGRRIELGLIVVVAAVLVGLFAWNWNRGRDDG
jgi:hypothetical protein